MLCEDCQLFEDKHYPCEKPNNEDCNEFFPKLEVLHKYLWALITDIKLMITFIKEEARKQKNYILSDMIKRYEKRIKLTEETEKNAQERKYSVE